MHLDVVEGPGRTDVHLCGSYDILCAAELLEVARRLAESGTDVAIQCADVTALDASCVQVLLALKRSLLGAGHQLEIRDVPSSVQELLASAGLVEPLIGDAFPPSTPQGA